jgi:hypothetical protein
LDRITWYQNQVAYLRKTETTLSRALGGEGAESWRQVFSAKRKFSLSFDELAQGSLGVTLMIGDEPFRTVFGEMGVGRSPLFMTKFVEAR